MSRDIHPGFTDDGQMAGLRFGVLGPLAVWRDGEPVAVPSGRRRAVLACLLIYVGRPVAADVLVEAGWGAERWWRICGGHGWLTAVRSIVLIAVAGCSG
jgi:hypothetical protein